MFKYFIIIFVIFKSFVTSEEYRLPNTTKPELYTIHIKTNLENDEFNFYGECSILLEILQTTNTIILHSALSEIESITLINSKGVKYEVIDFKLNSVNEFLTITFKNELMIKDKYILTIKYQSYLRTDKLGFYRSSYMATNGTAIWLASTQFAPTQARHAFPCFDEPNYKAEFLITITHPKNRHALSNTNPNKITSNKDGTVTTIFDETPKMSTYLIAFVISDFSESIYKHSNGIVEQKTYAQNNAIEYVSFTEDYCYKIYTKLSEYFDPKFPLKTLKHVALPDFYFGGMENWGLTTYKESQFLFKPNIYPVTTKLSIISLMSHEMAHQWFGNLVTMKWWTYVWLKEGFSTFYQYYGPEMIFPNWNIPQLFIIKKLHYVFKIDSDKSIRPMTHYVEKQSDIMANYDKIAYDKAACVIRMMNYALSESLFKNGINYYLNKNKYNSVTEEDFFDAIPTELNFSEIMKTWTSQSGYPVLTVTRNYKQSSFEIYQERYLDYDEKDHNSKWWIPINMVTSNSINFNETLPDFWINKKFTTITKPSNPKWNENDWLILNKQQTGYYRINYDLRNWKLITDALMKNHKNIHPNNRAQLIDDGFNFGHTKRLSYSIVLNLINYISKEKDYAPWAAFDNGMKFFKQHLSGDESYTIFLKRIQRILKPAYQSISLKSIENEEPIDALVRQLITNLACDMELKQCLEDKTVYDHPNLRAVYYCNRLRNSDNKIFIKLETILKNSTDSVIRSEIINSFGCVTNRFLLQIILLINKETIGKSSVYNLSSDERLQLLQSIYRQNQIGLEEVLEFLATESDTMEKLYPKDSLQKIIEDISNYINNVDLSEKFLKILSNVNIPESIAEKARRNVKYNLLWIVQNRDGIVDWTKSKNGVSSTKLASVSIIFCGIIFLKFF